MDLGTDVKMLGDYENTANGDLQTINGLENLREAIYRRILTMPGEIIHRKDYGVGARQYLNRPATLSNRQELSNAVKLNIINEKRIEKINEVSVDWDTDKCYITVRVTAYNQEITFDYEVVKL